MGRDHGDDPVLDANDAVRWAWTGAATAAPVIALLAVRDALDWPLWLTFLVAVVGGAAWGALVGLVRRSARRRRTRPVSDSHRPTT